MYIQEMISISTQCLISDPEDVDMCAKFNEMQINIVYTNW